MTQPEYVVRVEQKTNTAAIIAAVVALLVAIPVTAFLVSSIIRSQSEAQLALMEQRLAQVTPASYQAPGSDDMWVTSGNCSEPAGGRGGADVQGASVVFGGSGAGSGVVHHGGYGGHGGHVGVGGSGAENDDHESVVNKHYRYDNREYHTDSRQWNSSTDNRVDNSTDIYAKDSDVSVENKTENTTYSHSFNKDSYNQKETNINNSFNKTENNVKDSFNETDNSKNTDVDVDVDIDESLNTDNSSNTETNTEVDESEEVLVINEATEPALL